ncbi:MAG TPA: O-antigen ligase family protein [Sphingomicrobium sp.]
MISASFRHDDSGTFDAQVAVRLAAYSLAAFSVLFALGRRKLHLDKGIIVWTLVPLFIALTAFYAPERSFALTAGLGHLALLLFAWQVVNRHGQRRAVLAAIIAGTIICVASIFVFYAFPELGQSSLDSLNGDPGGRMRGVTAQPNSLGFISAVTVMLAVMHFRTFTARQRIFAAVAICIAAFSLIESDSRTSILALVLCLGMWALCRANAALNLFAVVGVGLLACLIIAFVPDVGGYLTRGGARSDDLTSFNGRWAIWDVVWEHIQAHPWIGQGYGASRSILPIDDRLFAAAVNSHNVYLELLFSGGVVLFGLYLIGMVTCVLRSGLQRRTEALVMIVFFLIVGAGEATPYAGLPLFPAAVFYIAVALCLARAAPRQVAQRPLPHAMAGRKPAFAGVRR